MRQIHLATLKLEIQAILSGYKIQGQHRKRPLKGPGPVVCGLVYSLITDSHKAHRYTWEVNNAHGGLRGVNLSSSHLNSLVKPITENCSCLPLH